MNRVGILLRVNGQSYEAFVEPRKLLSDVLREDLGLTGTHVGCEHGVCGACTVLVNGHPMRSCLMFAVQLEGAEITTIEAIAADGKYSALQQAFHEEHGLQCGFCTPGIILTFEAYLKQNPSPTEEQIRDVLSGNLCRCTGYQNIVKAIMKAAGTGAQSDGEVKK
ncbi:(2Fe-2S)-binding protein [Ferviditalea candida]|uniref:(2Fe-2S)-binding protein n=1 Tax=Ferviditalea candida TaxID=3108399 RepID=A0ABU5ZE97_9BACL|nr:(2Fe-2S)-binding protein [Paenibacillaceae bacterium T2]